MENLDRQKDEAIIRTFRGVSKHFADVFKELVPNGHGACVRACVRGGCRRVGVLVLFRGRRGWIHAWSGLMNLTNNAPAPPDTGRMVMKTTADTTKDITAEESEAEVRKRDPSHKY